MNHTEIAKSILRDQVLGDQLGLLTTCNEHGQPHATWMATYAFVDQDQIITLTSPDSLKAKNITGNHHVEWLFTSTDFERLIYFTGKAYLERDPAKWKRHWNLLPDKGRAYFLGSYNSAPGFAMVRTEVEHVYLTLPQELTSVELDMKSLLNEEQ